jgi:hypothetical protein
MIHLVAVMVLLVGVVVGLFFASLFLEKVPEGESSGEISSPLF